MRQIKLMRIFIMLLTFVFSANGSAVFAQTESTENKTSNSSQIRSVLQAVRAETDVPAITAAFITADSIKTDAIGVRRIDQSAAVRKADKFHIGSITKSVTSTLAAELVEAGLIRWTTKVGDAFPEFAAEMNPAFRDVTLEQLLRHRAGLSSYAASEEILSTAAYTGTPRQQRLAFTRDLLTRPPVFPVGEFNYSNAGYTIAGTMIERAAHISWDKLIKYGLFGQLDADAFIGWAAFNNPNQPFGHFEEGSIYSVPGQLFTPHDPNDATNLYSYFPNAISPSGNISLNAEDLAKYVQVHLRGLMGRNTGLLRSSTIKRLHRVTAGPIVPGFEVFYSSGWLEGKLDNVQTSTHSGSADTFYCVMAVQPTRGTAAVAIVNSGGERGENAAYHAVERLMGIGNLRTFGQTIP